MNSLDSQKIIGDNNPQIEIKNHKKSAKENSKHLIGKPRLMVMFIVALAFIMNILDATIVNIAIPSIQSELGASFSAIQWIVGGYLLSFGTLLILGGRLGDLFGYKKLFLTGVSGFTLASLLSGLAPNTEILILARILQGVFAALMVPQVLSMMQVLYDPHERAGISGFFGMLGGLSSSAGPILGGLLIEWNIAGLDWRLIFLINVPVGIIAVILGWKFIPKGHSTHPPKGLDYYGTAIIITTIGLFIYALIEGRIFGWPWWIFLLIVVSAILAFIFVQFERKRFKKDFPTLLVPILFLKRSFSAEIGILFFFAMTFIGFLFVFILTLEIGFGFTPLHAALLTIPVAIGNILSSTLFGKKLFPKFGSRVISFGAIFLGAGIILIDFAIRTYGPSIIWWQLTPGLFIFGLGMGILFSSVYAVLYSDIETKYAGAASGMQNAFQRIAGSVGIALIGVIFFGAITSHSPGTAQSSAFIHAFNLASYYELVLVFITFIISFIIPKKLHHNIGNKK